NHSKTAIRELPLHKFFGRKQKLCQQQYQVEKELVSENHLPCIEKQDSFSMEEYRAPRLAQLPSMPHPVVKWQYFGGRGGNRLAVDQLPHRHSTAGLTL